MDYESEEENDAAKDNEEEGEEEDDVENNTLEEAAPEAAAVKLQKKSQRAKQGKGGESTSQMRVNSVLESNPAIERYSYDEQQELWCEVSS